MTPNASSPARLRDDIREGRFRGPTAGQCAGFTQGNLAILPREFADEFLRFCRLNPKSCPVIGMTEPGDPTVPELSTDSRRLIDLRTDAPAYCVFRDGELAGEVTDLRALWSSDMVGFVIGCSMSFEEAMMDAGLPVRHIEQGTTVPMYDTNILNGRAGRFGGTMVVSMRPMTPRQAIRAIQVTSRFPSVHGAPVHFGDPAVIGIADVDRPNYGERSRIEAGEVPVFWACGVTPQQAIRSARPKLAITHKPGQMLVTDIRNSHFAVF